MGHERINHLKESLLCAIESQMCNLAEADAEELGQAVDMLKDLEEALYFCTITEAMNGKSKGGFNVEVENEYGHEGKSYKMSPMYYNDGRGGSRSYMDNGNGNGSRSNYSEPMMMRDYREGRSPESRRMYMEAKEKGHDKAIQLRELEKYMQELTSDMVDMIQDASPEEKQYLEKKISALASKIGQMK